MRTMTFNHVVPGQFVPTATMQAGGGSLTWIADLLAGTEDVERFDRLVGAAGAVEASGDELYFLPYLLGERSPYWNPRARGVFIGLGRQHGQAHLTRAVLEGVAFNLATCIGAFQENGAPVDRVDAIGGGAASDVWLQIMADVWGCAVRRRTVVEEANSLGAAVTAGVGVGLLPDFRWRGRCPRWSRCSSPTPRATPPTAAGTSGSSTPTPGWSRGLKEQLNECTRRPGHFTVVLHRHRRSGRSPHRRRCARGARCNRSRPRGVTSCVGAGRRMDRGYRARHRPASGRCTLTEGGRPLRRGSRRGRHPSRNRARCPRHEHARRQQ